MTIDPTSRDLDYCNAVIRSPEIAERILCATDPPASELDLASAFANPRNQVIIVNTESSERAGFFLCVDKGRGIYEVHTNLTCHGRDAFTAARLGIAWMFLATDCLMLTSYCPMNHPEVLSFAKLNGFKVDFTRPNAWIPKRGTPNAELGVSNSEDSAFRVPRSAFDVTHVVLHLHEWTRDRCADFAAVGHAFHEKLFAIAPHAEHPENGSHDGMVGLAFTMGVTHGNPIKAQLVFNDWAIRSGDAQLKFLGLFDGWTVFDMQTSIVAVNPEMEVRLLAALNSHNASPARTSTLN